MSAHNGPPSSFSNGRAVRDLNSIWGHQNRRVTPGLFNDADRAYRAKFLKAQEMSVRDKSLHLFYLWDHPEFRKVRLNPLRRLWQAPGEALERALRPSLGLLRANMAKVALCKGLWVAGFIWAGSYYFMYSRGDWTRLGGWRVWTSKPMTGPNNPNFPLPDPAFERTKPGDYNDRNFSGDPVSKPLSPSTPLQW